MGRKLHYRPGSFYRVDERTGFPQRAERTRKEWNNRIVDESVWEARQPQDLVRGVRDVQSVPDPRPITPATFVGPIAVQATQFNFAGEFFLEVQSTAGFAVNDVVSIVLDTGGTFICFIASEPDPETLVLSAPLPYSVSAGNLVYNVSLPAPSIAPSPGPGPTPPDPPPDPGPPDPGPTPDPDDPSDSWPTVNATPGTLAALMASTATESKILLTDDGAGGGNYTHLDLANLVKAGEGIIIEPAEGAVVQTRGFKLTSCTGFNFRHLDILLNSASAIGMELALSTLIGITDCYIHGSTLTAGLAIRYRGTTDCFLVDSEIAQTGSGISHIRGPSANNTGLTIARNEFHHLGSDACSGASDFLLFEDNLIHTLIRAGSRHPDGFQIGTPSTWVKTAPTNITVQRNVFKLGDGTPFQGIFMGGEQAALYLQNVLITQNACVGTMWNGIAIGRGQAPVIYQNFVQSMVNAYIDPTKPASGYYHTRISARNTHGGEIYGNTLSSGVQLITNSPNPSVHDNVFIGDAPANDYSQMEAWIAGLAG